MSMGNPVIIQGGIGIGVPGRKCLCNSLLANIGLAQTREGGELDKALLTAGDDIASIVRFIKPGRDSYRASEVPEDLVAAMER
jgi:nitronate monooxygenase